MLVKVVYEQVHEHFSVYLLDDKKNAFWLGSFMSLEDANAYAAKRADDFAKEGRTPDLLLLDEAFVNLHETRNAFFSGKANVIPSSFSDVPLCKSFRKAKTCNGCPLNDMFKRCRNAPLSVILAYGASDEPLHEQWVSSAMSMFLRQLNEAMEEYGS